MPKLRNITPCLWFDNRAEEAAKFYCGVFPNAKITGTTQYSETGQEIHGMRAGSVLTVEFELDGHPFTALNGGPLFKFSEAVSFQINCDTQDDVDHFWNRLREDTPADSGQCGWLKDKFGVSWQVVPTMLPQVLFGPDKAANARAMAAMLKMKKLDIAKLQEAYHG